MYTAAIKCLELLYLLRATNETRMQDNRLPQRLQQPSFTTPADSLLTGHARKHIHTTKSFANVNLDERMNTKFENRELALQLNATLSIIKKQTIFMTANRHEVLQTWIMVGSSCFINDTFRFFNIWLTRSMHFRFFSFAYFQRSLKLLQWILQ